jgi:hypothetical protein
VINSDVIAKPARIANRIAAACVSGIAETIAFPTETEVGIPTPRPIIQPIQFIHSSQYSAEVAINIFLFQNS